jgi:hypothetical protein
MGKINVKKSILEIVEKNNLEILKIDLSMMKNLLLNLMNIVNFMPL